MHYSLAILALAAIVNANPVAFPQAVTEKIFPTGTAPPGCKATLDFPFRIAISDVGTTTKQAKRAEASTTSCGPLTVAHVSQIGDGQVQGAIKYVTLLSVNQTGDCQLAPATKYVDGQLQAPILNTNPNSTPTSSPPPPPPPPLPTTTSVPIAAPAEETPNPSPPTVTSVPTTTSQPPPPTSTASIPAPVASSPPSSSVSSSTSTSSIPAPVASSSPSSPVSSSSTSVVLLPSPSSAVEPPPEVAPAASSSWHPLVICEEPGALAITLGDGVLKDQAGRTGYIAANYQFQFDGPPQAGALITAGFSICNNGSLALGGSNVFYKCLSGTFYNLYDRSWAAQCSPVTLNTLKLVKCT